VRVVPNLYPIVGGPDAGPGAGGVHEVVVLDPDHSRDLGRLTDAGVEELFTVLRSRARTHAAAGLAHVQVLVNYGRAAGASIAHPHAQVIATEVVPPLVRSGLDRFAHARTDVVAADFAASEGQSGRGRSDGAPAAWVWCPWGGASPYETRVSAPDAGLRLEDAADGALTAVACATRDVVAALASVLGDPAYNVVVHNAPATGDAPYHWYVTVVPRLGTVAGFELGTGLLVNTLSPADAAARLREAQVRP
jgi:UDPglucose--hexose-1-phosphate uridylyltransferase